eukprot:m.56758 g.56758  ORF g.56758 m.56758 type:complete len:381 (+) comp15742_c0_seq1:136-1278(+)
MRSVVVVALALLAVAHAKVEEDEGGLGGTVNCAASGEIPEKPRSLSFCHKFNDNACCPPALDMENNEMFDTMMNLGLSCRLRGDIRDNPMAKFYCMNCDPQQPKYVRNEPLVATCDEGESDDCSIPIMLYKLLPGDIFNDTISPDNVTLADVTSDDIATLQPGDAYSTVDEIKDLVLIPTLPRGQQILICSEWAEAEFGPLTDPSAAGFLSIFNRCGLMKSSPCLDGAGDIIPNRDRFTCGDDLILPSVTYSSVEQFLNADSMGPPALDESFGFKLVSQAICTPSQMAQYNATMSDPMQAGLLGPLEYNVFNPNCLRTIEQIKTYGVSPWSPSFSYDDVIAQNEYLDPKTAELCFDSAATFTPLVALSAVLLALAAVFVL